MRFRRFLDRTLARGWAGGLGGFGTFIEASIGGARDFYRGVPRAGICGQDPGQRLGCGFGRISPRAYYWFIALLYLPWVYQSLF